MNNSYIDNNIDTLHNKPVVTFQSLHVLNTNNSPLRPFNDFQDPSVVYSNIIDMIVFKTVCGRRHLMRDNLFKHTSQFQQQVILN